MSNRKLLTLLLFWFFQQVGTHAQQGSTSISDLVSGKPLSILDEELKINVFGKDNLPQAFQIKRKVRYKIIDQNGIEILSDFAIPEVHDPTFISHASKVKNIGEYYSGYDVKHLEVKVFRKGRAVDVQVKKRVKNIESFNIDYLYEYDRDHYYIKGLTIGDEVLIDYHLDIPFAENYSRFASYRVFFHDSIPKIRYKFILTHHETLDIELYGHNNAGKVKATERDRVLYYTWTQENLPGCLKEVNSRPYKELPHITWVINHYRYFVHNSNQLLNVPHYAIIASLRSPNLFDILRSVEIGSRSQQFLPFTKAYDKLTVGQKPNFERIRFLHNHIALNFNYQNDLDYYRRVDSRGDRLGEFFENGIVRDHNRYDFYYAFLIKSDEQFYSAFLIDKRSGEISDEFFQPTFDNDFLLANYFGENALDFMFPKRSEFGWFYNELPFYWEDCKTRLVHISDYAAYKQPISDVFRTGITPISKAEENRRSTLSKVVVDTDGDSLHFATQVQLSGQYSTLCRAAYMELEGDASVDQSYNTPVWEKVRSEKHLVEQSALFDHPPYQSEFNCTYSSAVEKGSASTKLSLEGLIDHVLPYEGDVRYLSYYTDFKGEDVYTYEFQFPRPVSMKKIDPINISNEFAVYSFYAEQVSANILRLQSSLSVKSDVLPSGDYEKIRQIKKAIKSLPVLEISFP
ncbi:MAG: hypothetical protein RIC15_04710 [Vicingaceae bacterium]